MNRADSTAYLWKLYDQLGLSRFMSRAEFRRGQRQLEVALLRVGLDAHLAELGGISFARAVDDDERFPFLSDLHNRITDFLMMDVPDEILPLAEQLRNSPEPPIAEEVRRWLVGEAGDQNAPGPRRALAEFLLFEAVRINLHAAAWQADGELERVGGTLSDIASIAEDSVRDLLAGGRVEEEVRPFHVLMSAAIVRLRDHGSRLKALLRTTGDTLATVWVERASIEKALRNVNPVDALLVLNRLAPYLRRQPLSIERLQKRHPLLLGPISRDALDQRFSRMLRGLKKRGLRAVRKRRRPAIIDILTDTKTGD